MKPEIGEFYYVTSSGNEVRDGDRVIIISVDEERRTAYVSVSQYEPYEVLHATVPWDDLRRDEE